MSPEHDPTPPPAGPGDATAPRVGRVWLCAQRSARAQRDGVLTRESLQHPARMLPDLAAAAIAAYSAPGQWVLDPMCGIGTTLVQAVRAGRHAVGIELEPRWVRIADDNLALAHHAAHHSRAGVVRGDARHLEALLPDGMEAPSLVLTSPPYGAGVHGRVVADGTPVVKYRHRYSPLPHRANLAHAGRSGLTTGMGEILQSVARVVAPGGHVVIVARPWRHAGVLVDLPGQLTACARAAGLVVVDRAVALLARIDRPDHPGAVLVPRASFFARHNVTRARAAGTPQAVIAHEDVIIARRPDTPTTSVRRWSL